MENLTINCRGKLLDFGTPRVMGILNLTPDSFFDGGKYTHQTQLLAQAEKMLEAGATILDLGGQSTRPGSERLSADEELKRLMPGLEAVLEKFPQAIISIDTYHAQVAQEAAQAGASIINDVSGGQMDELMFETIAKLRIPYVLMHLKGTPETMQQNPQYGNVTLEVLEYFAQKTNELKQMGVADIILDPGFGFGKNLDHNYQLVREFSAFKMLGYPLLVGVSRKSMICRLLNVTPENALNGTTVLNTLLLDKGANILRVHDVKEAVECIKIWELAKKAQP